MVVAFGEVEDWLKEGHEETFKSDEMFYNLTGLLAIQAYTFFKTQWILHL